MLSNYFGNSSAHRVGLSIMEVLFSIGVLLIGILGLASLIPVGANQSADAIRADKSVVILQNLVSQTVNQIEEATRSNFVSADFSSSAPRQSYSLVPSVRSVLNQGVCIDPWFLTAADNRRPPGTLDVRTGYDRTVFPCYDQGYNPLVAPSSSGVYTASGAYDSGWFDTPTPGRALGPRLARLSPSPSGYTYALSGRSGVNLQTPIAPSFQSAASQASQAAEPLLFLPKDKSLMPGRQFFQDTNRLVRPFTSGKYSAFALAQLDQNDPSQLKITTAVVENRSLVINPGALDMDFSLPSPAIGESRFELRDYTFDANVSPYYLGEQLLYISSIDNPQAFKDGIGGVITVVSHRYPTVPGVIPHDPPVFKRNQFVLFIRNVYRPFESRAAELGSANLRLIPRQGVEYAWFRIRDVVSGPVDTTITDPVHTNTTRDVWEAELEVRGTPWVFDDSARFSASSVVPYMPTVQDNTFAVFMPEVVSVFDRTVNVTFE